LITAQRLRDLSVPGHTQQRAQPFGGDHVLAECGLREGCEIAFGRCQSGLAANDLVRAVATQSLDAPIEIQGPFPLAAGLRMCAKGFERRPAAIVAAGRNFPEADVRAPPPRRRECPAPWAPSEDRPAGDSDPKLCWARRAQGGRRAGTRAGGNSPGHDGAARLAPASASREAGYGRHGGGIAMHSEPRPAVPAAAAAATPAGPATASAGRAARLTRPAGGRMAVRSERRGLPETLKPRRLDGLDLPCVVLGTGRLDMAATPRTRDLLSRGRYCCSDRKAE
jgi:hypothetical protein